MLKYLVSRLNTALKQTLSGMTMQYSNLTLKTRAMECIIVIVIITAVAVTIFNRMVLVESSLYSM